mmetsp:Transcript_14941/g.48056  ORF Transcript_14941/g.48056 Transcript_14941/m.48056 type:complete len:262 (+) Transcript_14941:748-1533(+)
MGEAPAPVPTSTPIPNGSRQANYLGHFALTTRLLPLLTRTAPERSGLGRVVHLTSGAHRGAPPEGVPLSLASINDARLGGYARYGRGPSSQTRLCCEQRLLTLVGVCVCVCAQVRDGQARKPGLRDRAGAAAGRGAALVCGPPGRRGKRHASARQLRGDAWAAAWWPRLAAGAGAERALRLLDRAGGAHDPLSGGGARAGGVGRRARTERAALRAGGDAVGAAPPNGNRRGVWGGAMGFQRVRRGGPCARLQPQRYMTVLR